MKKKNQSDFNIIHLFLGILLGIFLGSTAVYWHFDRQNDKFTKDLISQITSVFTENTLKTNTNSSARETTEITPTSKNSENRNDLPQTGITGEISIDQITQDEILSGSGSLFTESQNQLSVAEMPGNNEVVNMPASKDQNIVLIAQDKLLFAKRLTITNSENQKTESERRLESLVDNTATVAGNQEFFIEFWESPLNSLGYKMGKNKIIFYGIRLHDFASLSRYQGKIYLKYLNDFFPLELTTSFKPLIPVNDIYLLERLQ